MKDWVRGPGAAPRAAYIHLPFCLRKCGYCDFYSEPGDEGLRARYVRALLREIEHFGAFGRARWGDAALGLESVYFGGGTPSLFEGAQIEALLRGLDAAFGLGADCEITLEANPESGTPERMAAWRAAGVKRLSLGIQSLNDALLRRLGRLHDGAGALRALEAARRCGFTSLSADLMLGLPGQTIADLDATLEGLLRADLPHISLYALILEEGTPFFSLYADEAGLPAPEVERAMYHRAKGRLEEAGYTHYEISNFARPGHAARHNLVYWRAEPYWGFGAGAGAFFAGRRCANPRDLRAYCAAWEDHGGGCPEALGPFLRVEEEVDAAGAMREFFLLGLRLLRGVGEGAFAERFGALPPELEARLAELIERGLLELHLDEAGGGRTWRLSLKGLDFGNEVFRAFV